MSNKQASNTILKGIQYLIQQEIKKASIDKTLTGIIKEVKEDNLYDIFIGGILYEDIPSIFYGLNINDTVKIKVPQGQYSQMYIEGKFNIFDYNKIIELEGKIKLLEEEIDQLKGGTN